MNELQETFEGYFSNDLETQQNCVSVIENLPKTNENIQALLDLFLNTKNDSVRGLSLNILSKCINSSNEINPELLYNLGNTGLKFYLTNKTPSFQYSAQKLINLVLHKLENPWLELENAIMNESIPFKTRIYLFDCVSIYSNPNYAKDLYNIFNFIQFIEIGLSSTIPDIILRTICAMINLTCMVFQDPNYFTSYHDIILEKLLQIAGSISDPQFLDILSLPNFVSWIPSLQELNENNFINLLPTTQLKSKFISEMLAIIPVSYWLEESTIIEFLFFGVNLMNEDSGAIEYFDKNEFSKVLMLISLENKMNFVQEILTTNNIELIIFILEAIAETLQNMDDYYEIINEISKLDLSSPEGIYRIEALNILLTKKFMVYSSPDNYSKLVSDAISTIGEILENYEPSEALDNRLSILIKNIKPDGPNSPIKLQNFESFLTLYDAFAKLDFMASLDAVSTLITNICLGFSPEIFSQYSEVITSIILQWFDGDNISLKKNAYSFFSRCFDANQQIFFEYFDKIIQQMKIDIDEPELKVNIIVALYNMQITLSNIENQKEVENFLQIIQETAQSIGPKFQIEGSVTESQSESEIIIAKCLINFDIQTAFNNFLILCSCECVNPPSSILDLFHQFFSRFADFQSHFPYIFKLIMDTFSKVCPISYSLFLILGEILQNREIAGITDEDAEKALQMAMIAFDTLLREKHLDDFNIFQIIQNFFIKWFETEQNSEIINQAIEYWASLLSYKVIAVGDMALFLLSFLSFYVQLPQEVINQAFQTIYELLNQPNAPFRGAGIFISACIKKGENIPENIMEIINIGIEKSKAKDNYLNLTNFLSSFAQLVLNGNVNDDLTVLKLVLEYQFIYSCEDIDSIINYLLNCTNNEEGKEIAIKEICKATLVTQLSNVSPETRDQTFNYLNELIKCNPSGSFADFQDPKQLDMLKSIVENYLKQKENLEEEE
ncbi:hypothetical protein TVAG_210120 [Trichomonas vaginalis G3]|uniref:Uncharacterized protein n=1 Tax=Trichomonas vaginalis (strain ATCC PRA-98 / G3) TaxID=412133 RepID=A2DVR9_TRIV3|nr:armadillo (ARM) repeat-containing protein family [Trichomonas vaginalis G3]EAY15482.1 hypothetical protein TVAG_210120 [Trichomonas vaginalis G3]KAI5511492.1 armadillo (ARM) repeat-containing protein family [Trichomonas vaginalis G3]|eukprot:XP_001327705.1 hypothetical protein [Trichomonas vaginalis G3]